MSLFLGLAYSVVLQGGIDLANAGMHAQKAGPQVIFVLGGPGSGKGTQVCYLFNSAQHSAASAAGQEDAMVQWHDSKRRLFDWCSVQRWWRSLGCCTLVRETYCVHT